MQNLHNTSIDFCFFCIQKSIKLHISAYFHCMIFAYLANAVYIFAYFVHISCILLAYTCISLAYK